jgi:CBS domain-containing protein
MITVREIMTTNIISVKANESVEKVAELLARNRISGMPVVDEAGHVVGMVSEIDVITKKGKTAADIMSKHVISVSPDTGVEEAALILAGKRIRRMPVIEKGKMIGIVSRADVLNLFASIHWTCERCGHYERGLVPPKECAYCQGTEFTLQRGSPGF